MMHSVALRGLPPLAAALLAWLLPAATAQAADCTLPAASIVQRELMEGYIDHAREEQV